METKCIKQSVEIANDRWTHPWKENSFLVPLPCWRTTSTIGDFLPLSPLRSRSAPVPYATAFPSGGNVMSRNNVSVARFYDLSEDRQGTASVSHIYREIARTAGGQLSLSEAATKKAEGLQRSMSKTNTRVSPGRMFIRDKGFLTKGEREIIKGICKNRGDLRRDDCSQSDMKVRSHHEAWLVGKTVNASKAGSEVVKDQQRGALLEVTSSGVAGEVSRLDVIDGNQAMAGGESHHAYHCHCLMCLKRYHLQQLNAHLTLHLHPPSCLQTSRSVWPLDDGGYLMTPPSTPEPAGSPVVSASHNFQPYHHIQTLAPFHHTYTLSPRLPHRRLEPSSHETITVTPFSAHSLVVEQQHPEDTEHSDSGSQNSRGRRKVQVKVYLPNVGADAVDDDIKACILHGKPMLARERHINQNDLRPKKLHKDNFETMKSSPAWERLPTKKDRNKPRVVTLTNRSARGTTVRTGTGRSLPA